MRESFYTYLGGPRTFWGGDGRTTITNNFYGGRMMSPFACGMPMFNYGMPTMSLFNYGYGGCGCNSGMSNIMGYMALNQMISGMFNSNSSPQEGAGGVAQGATQGGPQNLTTMQNTMNQMGFNSANGYSVSQNADGSLQFTYNKDGKTIIASSLPELMGKVNGTSTQNEQASEHTSLEDSLAVHKPEKTDEDNTTDAADNDDGDDSTVKPSGNEDGNAPETPAAPATPRTPARKASRHHIPNLAGQKIGGKELEWKGYNRIDSNTKVGKYIKENIKNGTSLDRLVNVMLPRASKQERAKYKQWVIDGNPNGIKDGKVVDVNKLDLPVYKAQSAGNKTLSSSSKIGTVTGKQITYGNNSKNSIYKDSGGLAENADTDAIFRINGNDYRLQGADDGYFDAFDYWDITGQRSSWQNDYSVLIDQKTGKFMPNNEILTKKKGFKLDGNGPLHGAQIVLDNGKVVLKDKKGKILGSMDEIMLGKIKTK